MSIKSIQEYNNSNISRKVSIANEEIKVIQEADARRKAENEKYNAITNILIKELTKRNIPYEEIDENIEEIISTILASPLFSKRFGSEDVQPIINATKEN